MESFDCGAWEEEANVENAIMNDGINFDVKYIGCIEITQSMKALDFQTRQVKVKSGARKRINPNGLLNI
jgi:hypothetical protein